MEIATPGGERREARAGLVISRLVTLSSPLSSHLIVTCWILASPPAWSPLMPGRGRRQPVPCYPSPLSRSGLAAPSSGQPGLSSPLSLLTAILSSQLPATGGHPSPPVQPILILAGSESCSLCPVRVSLSLIPRPSALMSSDQGLTQSDPGVGRAHQTSRDPQSSSSVTRRMCR